MLSCFVLSVYQEAGYSPELGDTNDDVGFLCREFVKSREGNQSRRRIAARIFCLTGGIPLYFGSITISALIIFRRLLTCMYLNLLGYPLTPTAAQDCRIFCDASKGMKWRVSLDSDHDEEGIADDMKNTVLKEPGMETRGVISTSVLP